MKQINKLLIANRGEIALRIMRTCKTLEIETLAIYNQEDQYAWFVQEADDAVFLPGNTLQETYLNQELILSIAKEHHVDAIHPGYGFLSENASFALACKHAGVLFVGPPASAIELMGDKVASRKFAEQHHIPLLKGITGNQQELLAQKNKLDFPVMIKASAGGGGKGMRVVMNEKEFDAALEATAREAKSYFGNDEVFIERYIQNPRHIEVQVLGDQHGNMVHLFERECTIQRRHQKIIEEAPSISLNEQQRNQIGKTAIELAKACGYYSAGTVEFIVDEQMNFYFMEMNTRIQVEHPVTELITACDIVEEQIRIAQGEVLPEFIGQSFSGHAIECRIYAENPRENFQPSPGYMTYYKEPNTTQDFRIDSGVFQAQEISGSFDPMISKLVVWGEDREEAIVKAQEALNQYVIRGINTNIDYLKMILADERYQQNEITTNYCKEHSKELFSSYDTVKELIDERIVLFAGLAYDITPENPSNLWSQIGFYRPYTPVTIFTEQTEYNVFINQTQSNTFEFIMNEEQFVCKKIAIERETGVIQFYYNNEQYQFIVHQPKENEFLVQYEAYVFSFRRKDVLDNKKDYSQNQLGAQSNLIITSPIPGTVVKVLVTDGDKVKKNDPLLIVEAMKMENTYTAYQDGIVETVAVHTGDKVTANQLLIKLQDNE